MALAVATAASIALPPFLSASIPAWLALRSVEATAPLVPVATACCLLAAAAAAGRAMNASRDDVCYIVFPIKLVLIGDDLSTAWVKQPRPDMTV
jgi:hypothetical protein